MVGDNFIRALNVLLFAHLNILRLRQHKISLNRILCIELGFGSTWN